MEKPEKLFDGANDWTDIATRPGGTCWQVNVGRLSIELLPPRGRHLVKWVVSIGNDPLSYFESEQGALEFIRSHIIAHRDELLRIAPVEFRWVSECELPIDVDVTEAVEVYGDYLFHGDQPVRVGK